MEGNGNLEFMIHTLLNFFTAAGRSCFVLMLAEWHNSSLPPENSFKQWETSFVVFLTTQKNKCCV